jgi:Zn-dependent peptidase ImmA (M78 family)
MSPTAVYEVDRVWDSDIRALQTHVPVNVVGMADAIGLKVWTKGMPENVSGMIKKDLKFGGPAGYSIIVNKMQPRVRQRFTVAHEIAHYLLHRDRIGDGLEDDALFRSGLSTIEEVQANKLAARILMPFHLLRREMSAGNRTLPGLAARFEVSQKAMSIRLGLPE